MLADPWAGRGSIVSLSRSSSLLLLRRQWQSHHRSAQSFAYSPRFLYHACVSLSLSRRATRFCSRGSVGALRMHLLRGIPHAERKPIVTRAQLHPAERNGDRLDGSSIRLDPDTPANPPAPFVDPGRPAFAQPRSLIRENRILGIVRCNEA